MTSSVSANASAADPAGDAAGDSAFAEYGLASARLAGSETACGVSYRYLTALLGMIPSCPDLLIAVAMELGYSEVDSCTIWLESWQFLLLFIFVLHVRGLFASRR